MAVGGRIIVPVELKTSSVRAALTQSVTGAMKAASLVVGAGLAGFVAMTVKAGLEYDAALNEMQAVSGATAAQMAQVDQQAKALGADASIAGASATDAARAMTELAKGGFSVEDSMTAARGSLQLAAAAGIDAAQAANIQVKMIQTFALQAKDATHVADILASTANATSLEIGDVAASMQQFGAVAHLFGIDAGDAAVAVASLAEAGIAGSDAGTSLKTMLIALANPSDKAAAALATLGIKAYDQSGKFVGLESIMTQLSKAQRNLTQETFQQAAATAFGSDSIRAASALAAEGAAGYERLAKATDQQGAAAALAAAKNQGLVGLVSQIQNNIENLFLETYQELKPTLTALAEFGLRLYDIIAPVVKFGAAIAGNTVVVRTLAIAGGIFFAVWAAAKFVLLANGVRVWALSMVGSAVAAGSVNGALALLRARLLATAAGQTVLSAAVLVTRGYFLVATAAGTLFGAGLRAVIVAGRGTSLAMSILTGSLAVARGGFAALWAVAAANPLVAIATLLAAAAVAFLGYKTATGDAGEITDSLTGSLGSLLGALGALLSFDFPSLMDKLKDLANVGDPGNVQSGIASDAAKVAEDNAKKFAESLRDSFQVASAVSAATSAQMTRDFTEIRQAWSTVDWKGGAVDAASALSDVADGLAKARDAAADFDGIGSDMSTVVNGITYDTNDFNRALAETGHAGETSNVALAAAASFLEANRQRYADLNLAVNDATELQQNLVAALNGTGSALGLSQKQVSDYALLMGYTARDIATGVVSASQLTSAVTTVRDALANAGPKMNDWQAAVQKYSDSAQSAADKSDLLKAAIDALTGKDLDLVTAKSNATDAIYGLSAAFDQAREAAAKHGQQLFLDNGALNTQAVGAKAVNDALTGLRGSALDVAQATYAARIQTTDQATAAKDAATAFRDNLDNALRAHQKELGLTDGQVQGLITQYGNLPDDVVTQAILNDLASTGIAGVTNKLAGLDGSAANVSANANVAPALAALDDLGRRIVQLNNSSVYVQTSAGRAALAGGGFFPAVQTFAVGGVREAHVAQIARSAPGLVRVWAEHETGGESYIPHARDWRRAAAHQIMRRTAEVLGGQYIDEAELARLRRRAEVRRFSAGGMTRVTRAVPPVPTTSSAAVVGRGGDGGLSVGTIELYLGGEAIDVRVDKAVIRGLDGVARELEVGKDIG